MSFTIRKATAEDAPGICRLFTRVFPREMSLAEWRWKYPENPDGWLSVVAEVDGTIAGHYGGWGARVLLDGEEALVYSLCDLSTDPDYRQTGGRHRLFRSMAEEWNGCLKAHGIPFSYGFPGAHALGLGGPLVGYRAHFPVRELGFPLAGEPRPPDRDAALVGPSFDGLWNAARPLVARAGLVRDRERVNWRFSSRPDRTYRRVLVEEPGGECAAWAVLALLGPSALVMDYLLRDSGAGTFERLWTAVRGEAAAMGASRLVFWEPPGGPWRPLLLDKVGAASGEVRDAGFGLATAVVHDEAAFSRFVRHLHFTPGFYDDR